MTVKKTRKIPVRNDLQNSSKQQEGEVKPEKVFDIPATLKDYLVKIDHDINILQGKKADLVSGFLMANDVDINMPFSTDQAYTQVSVYTPEAIQKLQQNQQ
jgi:hypothetical protein